MNSPRKPEARGPPRPCVHFVGFRDDCWWNAVRIFGRPDFIHPRWEMRARREIADGDIVVLVSGVEARPVARHNESDLIDSCKCNRANGMGTMMSNWVCPFCNRAQTLTAGQRHSDFHDLYLKNHKYRDLAVLPIAIACANEACKEVTLRLFLYEGSRPGGDFKPVDWNVRLGEWDLRPTSSAKVLPQFVPEPLRNDYEESCLIKSLSPKASATLARRCLQGMIRDFCNIKHKRLVDEIRALRAAVDTGTAPQGVTADTMEAIDAVREIGNIGAHMETDINVIVDVDPGEAQALIELIELLFEEWYVARHRRQERLAGVKALAATKKAELEAARAKALMPPDTPE